MYQFTREFIVNDNKGKLNGDKRFFFDGTTFKLQGGCNIRKQDVNAVYKAEGADEEIEHIIWDPTSIDTTNLKKDDVIRLTFVLGLENRVHPLFNDYYPDHTQSFFYEAKVEKDQTFPIAGLIAAINAERNRFENLYFTQKDGETSKLDITLMDCYTRLESLLVVKVNTDVDPLKTIAANLTGYEDYEVLEEIKDRQEVLKATSLTGSVYGTAGKFTTNYLVQNVRLLTDAAINPYGINMDERPLPRSVYNQYMVECISERRHIGHQVMGSIDHSLTTYVFFVLKSDTQLIADFETALGGIGTIVTGKNAPVKQVIALKADVEANAADDATLKANVQANAASIAANAAADANVAEVVDNTIAAVKGVHTDDATISALKNTKGK